MELTKRQTDIVQTAISIIAQEGYKELTTKNIARQMKLTEAALYRHFENKHDLIIKILQYFASFSSDVLEQIRLADLDPLERVHRFVMNRYELFSSNPDLAQVMFSEEIFHHDPSFSEQMQKITHTHKDEIIAYLEEAKLRGQIIKDPDSLSLFRIIVGSMRLLVTQWNLSGHAFDLIEEGDKLFNTIKISNRGKEMKRQIINIDPVTCTGCGDCITGCPEGAIQLIDGKARLVSDLFCDGLGACIGTCPVGAIHIEEREAEPYSEALTIENIIPHGENTIKAHLNHLKSHGETTYYTQALEILKQKGFDIASLTQEETLACGCSGTHARKLEPCETPPPTAESFSQLRQWPVQLQLLNPAAEYFENADLLISADCVPYAFGDFHNRFLKGKVVITFCPKLDQQTERYIDKLAQIFTLHTIKSVTVVRMEVPCCGGTEYILQKALEQAGKMHFVKINIISVDGKII